MRKPDLAKIDLFERKSEKKSKCWSFETEIITVKDKKVLVVDCFYSSNVTASYRIFFWNGDKYTSYDYINNKFRECKIEHLIPYWNLEEATDNEVLNCICKFLNTKQSHSSVYSTINSYQDQVCKKRLHEKYERDLKWINDKMNKEIKPLPENFSKWIDDKGLYQSKYIIYQYTSKKMKKCYCTHCHSDFEIENPKHGMVGKCVVCGCDATYKASGKIKTLVDSGSMFYLDSTSNGFVIRQFNATKYYNRKGGYRNPELYYYETTRMFFDSDMEVERRVEWELYKQWKTCWCDSGNNIYTNASVPTYSENLKEVIISRYDFLRYSAIDQLVASADKVSIIRYLQGAKYGVKRYHNSNYHCTAKNFRDCIEKLTKIGLYRLANDFICNPETEQLDASGSNQNKILGIQNDDIKILIDANASQNGLKLFKAYRERGKRLTSEQLRIINDWDNAAYEEIAKVIPIEKMIKYLENKSIDHVQAYRDYLNGCKKLNYDLKNSFIAYPKNIKDAHDQVMNALEKEKHSNSNLAISKLEKMLNESYGYRDKKYLIRAPHNADEIVEEGTKLHHCVGRMGYIERMVKGDTYIMFLRKVDDPDTPYYTIELFDNKIRQVHGFGNNDVDINEITPFINRFKRMIRNKAISNQKVG